MIKFVRFFLLIFCFLLSNLGYSRVVRSINDSWNFKFGGSISDNTGWSIVSIPHTWNDKDCLDDTPRYARGKGWYKKTIEINSEMSKAPLYIFFEGANQRTELFINGDKVGEHLGGYTFFSFDISKYVKEGKNEFIVCVDNSHDVNIPPLSADFTFFGGIYRDVSLISTSPIHLSLTHYASKGVYITTPKVDEKKALVSVKYMLTNSLANSETVYLESYVYSPTGKIVASHKKKIRLIENKDNQEFIEDGLVVENPSLWDIDSPSQYRLKTCLYDKKGVKLDELSTSFGIRTFSFSVDEGFVLNGKQIKLIGTNRHQCYKEKGNALRDEMHVRDVRLLQQMGGNFLRIAHYPQDEMVLAACDRMGIVTSVEIPVIDKITMSEDFSNCCVNMMKEMIYQNFNSPSVCIWTYMNEVMLRPPYVSDKSIDEKEYCKYVYDIAEKIENTARKIDPYRYTMLPCHNELELYEKANLTKLPQILGFNLYNGWYIGTFDGFEKGLERIHEKYPNTPLIVSEYGADMDNRVHSYSPERFDYSVEYGVLYHRHYLPEIIKRKYVVASAVWNLNDFHSEGRSNALPHINCKGLVSLDRIPKDPYLYYQAMLLNKPYVAISGKDWVYRTGISDSIGVCKYPVLVYSNSSQVIMYVNGERIGDAAVNNGAAEFDIPFRNGKNVLEAVIEKDGHTVRDLLTVSMNLVPDKPKLYSGFRELNVMMGSNRFFEDRDADFTWMPEREYSKDGWGYIGGSAFRNPSNYGTVPASGLDILGTDQDPLFQTQRRGVKSFKADVPDGEYVVYLYWTELSGNKSKSLAYQLGDKVKDEKALDRSFHVDINGNRIFDALNVKNEVGNRRPMICRIPVSVFDNTGLNINFIPVNGETMLSAVRIIKLD